MLFGKNLLVCISSGILLLTPVKEQKIKILDDQAIINLHLASKDITGSVGGLITDVYFDPENLHKSFVKAELSTQTISTGNKLRDIKLMSKKFLNKKKYEKITFKSKKIVAVDNGYIINGEINIKGIVKPTAIDAVYSEGVIVAFASINLMDYDIEFSDKRNENKLDIYIKLRVLRDGIIAENESDN
ncbi:hypothetical protein GTQ40_06610 [Flavobacteriaceae bacterium R38]|nr:hypothetical protein [Flavobacteriaceae bacterium R38]